MAKAEKVTNIDEARNKADKRQPRYEVIVSADVPVVELKGDIISLSSTEVVINHKKPRSSKRLISRVPMSDVIYVKGEAGGEGIVARKTREAELTDFVSKSIKSLGNGFAEVRTDEGDTFTVNETYMRAVAEEDGAPKAGKEKEKKDKKSKK
jgi:hypothetical protein